MPEKIALTEHGLTELVLYTSEPLIEWLASLELIRMQYGELRFIHNISSAAH